MSNNYYGKPSTAKESTSMVQLIGLQMVFFFNYELQLGYSLLDPPPRIKPSIAPGETWGN
jgi:hypothetical protein